MYQIISFANSNLSSSSLFGIKTFFRKWFKWKPAVSLNDYKLEHGRFWAFSWESICKVFLMLNVSAPSESTSSSHTHTSCLFPPKCLPVFQLKIFPHVVFFLHVVCLQYERILARLSALKSLRELEFWSEMHLRITCACSKWGSVLFLLHATPMQEQGNMGGLIQRRFSKIQTSFKKHLILSSKTLP